MISDSSLVTFANYNKKWIKAHKEHKEPTRATRAAALCGRVICLSESLLAELVISTLASLAAENL